MQRPDQQTSSVLENVMHAIEKDQQKEVKKIAGIDQSNVHLESQKILGDSKSKENPDVEMADQERKDADGSHPGGGAGN